jgi:endonuclease/exonuclease/phosphatase family metal-dependent hydrolase
MAPGLRLALAARVLLLSAICVSFAAPAAHALRIVNYNILNYPGTTGATRDPHFRTILAPLAADIVVVQEIQSQAGVNEFLNSVLNTLEPGQWSAAPFYNGNDTDNALFYRTSAVQYLGSWAFYPNPSTNLRFVVCYRMKPAGYSHESAELRIYSQHLKASSGSANVAARAAEAVGIRDSMNAVPPGTHCILMGDFNIYTGTEPAFTTFLANQADNDGRLYDPLNLPLITWNTGSLAPYHTQSPCNSGCPGGFATGGLDDRFDMFLPTYNLNDGQGLELLAATYIPVGNDGQHYNKNIIDLPTIPEGAAYANALFNSSDHLPIRVDIQLPAKIGAPAALALGTVIVGGGALLAITNPSVTPAELLQFSFVAPAGFAAPAGGFQLAAGAPPALHAIVAPAGTLGPRAGNLTIASNDPDEPARLVALTATVLGHARPSLDSTALMTAGVLDFGQHEAGMFPTMPARIHNFGFSSTQAKLEVTGASIIGGDGRFSFVGGFSPAELAGTGETYEVAFDDAGATSDSVYEATLEFMSEDEPLPAALSHEPLSLTLRAERTSGTVAVEDRGLPQANVLYAPYPNPVRGTASTIRFDLARRTDVRLEVFDLNGRRVAALAQGDFAPGRYAFQWGGRDAIGSALGSGLYFVRLTGAGLEPQMRRIAIIR